MAGSASEAPPIFISAPLGCLSGCGSWFILSFLGMSLSSVGSGSNPSESLVVSGCLLSMLSWVLPIVVAIVVGVVIHSRLVARQKSQIAHQEAARRIDDERRRAREAIEQEARERAQYYQRLESLNKQALVEHEALTRHIERAVDNLDQAERLYQSRAYRPFWQAISDAVFQIEEYQSTLQRLLGCKRRFHAELASPYWNEECPNYPTESDKVPQLDLVSRRLEKLLWLGQTESQFASILEQIRTQEILIKGFSGLSDAIFHLGGEVRRGFSEVSSELESIHSEKIRETETEQQILDTLRQIEENEQEV